MLDCGLQNCCKNTCMIYISGNTTDLKVGIQVLSTH